MAGGNINFDTGDQSGGGADGQMRMIGDKEFVPDTPGQGTIGTAGAKFLLMTATTGNFGDLVLSGDEGNWTLRESDECIFVINNRTGKRFKMALQEVD